MACRCGPPGTGGSCRRITQFVLKVHSRCDLSCDHCYVYQLADQTWRGRPREMAPEVARAAAGRIAEHAAAHGLPVVHVVLHGGEPLLLGVARMRELLTDLRAALDPLVTLDLRMQTNGVLLDPAFCELFVEFGVKVGVSLDGHRVANDRHRRFAHGASSHHLVRRALALLRRPGYQSSYAGILCTVDVRNDPDAVYAALLAERPPRVDLLLPHATWDSPPLRPGGAATPYGDWLGRIHRRWIDDGRPVPIRLFDALLTGGTVGGTEAVGTAPADLVVIETDGTWEQADSLKVAYHGAAGTGLDVFGHSVDEAAGHPGIVARQGGVGTLCATCRACPVVDRCGGGLYAHRHRAGTGFDNPSVYCADLRKLIDTVDAYPARGHRSRSARPDPDGAPSAELLTELATGHGGSEALRLLAATQLSITRALLAAWRDAAGRTDAWDLLADLDARAPGAVRAVLRHPFVRPWLVSHLDPSARGGPAGGGDLVPALAAAAAVRAKVETEVAVPVRAGAIMLPTLGRLSLPVAAGATAVLRTSRDGFRVRVGTLDRAVSLDPAVPPSPGWQPTHVVPVGGAEVVIEDADPERDCYGQPVAPRLGEPAAGSWGRTLARAWRVVHRDVPAHGAALDAGLRAVVPLASDPASPLRSATARHAFGAVAVTGAPDPETVAVLLVHEWQHAKLGALLDLHDLVDPAPSTRIPVAWRPDPRPPEGVLQGAYAHLAVTEVWRSRADADGPGATAAREHAERYLAWTRDAVDALLASGALTDPGERFVGRMRQALEEPHVVRG